MKILSLAELQELLKLHTFLRMEEIPLETGLIVDDRFLLVPTAEGELTGVDMKGIENIYYGTDETEQ